MKMFYFLFSIYFFFVFTMPCGDVAECNEKAKASPASVELITNHASHEHQEENCSPFCVCSCCGATVISITNNIHKISIAAVLIDPFFTQPASEITEVAVTIWQPPKSA